MSKRLVADLVRGNIRELTPYRCARDDYSEGVLLDANENSYGPSLPAGKVCRRCLIPDIDGWDLEYRDILCTVLVATALASE